MASLRPRGKTLHQEGAGWDLEVEPLQTQEVTRALVQALARAARVLELAVLELAVLEPDQRVFLKSHHFFVAKGVDERRFPQEMVLSSLL